MVRIETCSDFFVWNGVLLLKSPDLFPHGVYILVVDVNDQALPETDAAQNNYQGNKCNCDDCFHIFVY